MEDELEEIKRLIIGRYKDSRKRRHALLTIEEAKIWLEGCEPAPQLTAIENIEFVMVSSPDENISTGSLWKCRACVHDTLIQFTDFAEHARNVHNTNMYHVDAIFNL